MNILVITSYFGPETSVGVMRINAFVKYWSQLGHKIYVITMPYSGELPGGIKDNPNLEIVQIPPLFLRGRQSGGVQGYSKGAKGYVRSLLRLQYWMKKHIFANYLDPRVLWWPRVALFILRRLIDRVRFDFMLTTVPSYTAHSAAAVVKRFSPKLLWVADYRDLWCGNPIFPGCAGMRVFERNHERMILKNADLIVSINEPLISELSKIHGKRSYLEIPNGFDDDDLNLNSGKEIAGKKPWIDIVYTGSILPGGYQDPSPLLQAIKELASEGRIKEGDLFLQFYGDSSALEEIPLARDCTVGRFIKRCGKVSRQDILNIQRSADFLLFLGSTPLRQGGSTVGVVSGKIFEYLISGTEVMAVGVTEEMLVADMLAKSSTGDWYGSDVEKLKKRIAHAIEFGVKKVEPNMDYLDQFKRSTQAKKLLTEIKSVL